MAYPSDLPHLIEYRVGNTVRVTLPRQPVVFVSSSGMTNAATVCPRIPLGATGWRLPGETNWRKWADVPEAWRPFLQRQRETPMDPRPALKEK